MESSRSPSTIETLSRYRWVILALAFVSQFTATLAVQVVPPLAPLLQSELGLSKVEIGFFSSSAFIGSWAVLLVGGYLTERFGVRRMMAVGQMLGGAVMLAMAFTGSFLQAALVMVVVGLCRGMVHPGASKAVMDWFPARERATAMGVKQTGYPVGGIILAATLPALALTLGWRYAIALVGFVFLAGGVATAFMYRDPSGRGAGARGTVSMRGELRELLRNEKLWILNVTALMLVTAQLGLVAYLALYFSDVILPTTIPEQGARIIAAGGFLALLQAGGVAGRILWGLVSDRMFPGRRLPLMAAAGGLSGLMALVVASLGVGLPLWLLGIVVFVYGSTALGWNGLNQALIVETSGPNHAAIGVGFCMTLTQAGTVAGPPLFGFIVDATGTYQAAWLFVSALSLTAALLALLYTRHEDRSVQKRAVIAEA